MLKKFQGKIIACYLLQPKLQFLQNIFYIDQIISFNRGRRYRPLLREILKYLKNYFPLVLSGKEKLKKWCNKIPQLPKNKKILKII